MPRPAAPLAPLTLRNFHVKRAGGRMTAYGTDIETGEDAKVTNIDRIDPPASAAEHHVLATDKHGLVHKLTFA